MTAIDLPVRPRILVIALRRLGDVLLTTPLIRGLKRGYPDATIDVLVFSGTEGILEGNPDIGRVITMPVGSGGFRMLALLGRLWRRYDLAVSTQTGDRPFFFTLISGTRRAGMVEASGVLSAVKRKSLHRAITVSRGSHRVDDVLQLADTLGVPRIPEVVVPKGNVRPGHRPALPYAVIHAVPMFHYKRWTDKGWRALAATLVQHGMTIVATGGPSVADRNYLDLVWRGMDVRRLDGALAWPELAALIRAASVYIGPDTSVTHLAAGTGCPTVALYGPTDPRLWGPWPAGGLREPWAAAGTIQQRGNVWLVQNPLPCMPCQLEGCERRLDSYSACLDELGAPHVLAAVNQALATAPKS
ncbi:MAG: glycosyltransferase family 9 protein [Rhizobiales bacterium]|nr:glycosyltransferase family 9 protein [Hyphomicrobiales bacterium]